MNYGIILGIFSSIAGIWVFIKYILIVEIRLDNSIGKDILKYIKNRKYIAINEELSTKEGIPNIFSCLVLVDKIPIYFNRGERMLSAGWRSVDTVTNVITFRFFNKYLKKKLKSIVKDNNTINVNVIGNYGYNKIGTISKQNIIEPLFEKDTYKDIEEDIRLLLKGEIDKSGFLLYGPPGNGKTQFIRYIALKYSLNVAILTFNSDYTNEDIILMFSEIPDNSIVLLEDFDSVFDKRNCLIKSENIKFTFDGLLNSLDGIWNSNKRLVYCITCNDLDKIDNSIKNRRSRIKFIREIKLPTFEIRNRIFNNYKISQETEGLSLDKVFYVKNQLESGFDFKYIMQHIND